MRRRHLPVSGYKKLFGMVCKKIIFAYMRTCLLSTEKRNSGAFERRPSYDKSYDQTRRSGDITGCSAAVAYTRRRHKAAN